MAGTRNAAKNVMFWLMFFTVIITALIAFAVSSRT